VEKPRTRLAVLVSGRRLDRELASGRDPGCSDAHRLRARELTDASTRHHLARSLRSVVSDAARPPRSCYTSAAPPLRREVIACREGLLGVADRLEGPGPLNVCGVARVMSLITDGAGPVYSRGAERSLIDAVWWIADGLQQSDAHDWESGSAVKRA
jgi:hypothetical protein